MKNAVVKFAIILAIVVMGSTVASADRRRLRDFELSIQSSRFLRDSKRIVNKLFNYGNLDEAGKVRALEQCIAELREVRSNALKGDYDREADDPSQMESLQEAVRSVDPILLQEFLDVTSVAPDHEADPIRDAVFRTMMNIMTAHKEIENVIPHEMVVRNNVVALLETPGGEHDEVARIVKEQIAGGSIKDRKATLGEVRNRISGLLPSEIVEQLIESAGTSLAGPGAKEDVGTVLSTLGGIEGVANKEKGRKGRAYVRGVSNLVFTRPEAQSMLQALGVGVDYDGSQPLDKSKIRRSAVAGYSLFFQDQAGVSPRKGAAGYLSRLMRMNPSVFVNHKAKGRRGK